GEVRQIRDRLVIVQLLREEVLPPDDRLEPELVGGRDELAALGQLLRGRRGPRMDRVEEQDESHTRHQPSPSRLIGLRRLGPAPAGLDAGQSSKTTTPRRLLPSSMSL